MIAQIIKLLNWTNLLALLAFLPIVVSYYDTYKKKDKVSKGKKIATYVIGSFILIVAIIKNTADIKISEHNETTQDSLLQNIVDIKTAVTNAGLKYDYSSKTIINNYTLTQNGAINFGNNSNPI